jgi:hypothetical protein
VAGGGGALLSTAGSINGAGSAARFNQPRGVAVDVGATTLFVADTLNHLVR